MDEKTDEALYQAAKQCLESGVNVVDSAINYRAQRSERVIGKVIRDMLQAGSLRRDEVFISTKGGFIPFDGYYPQDLDRYLADTYLTPGILNPDDVVEGCHAITPRFLEHSLSQSLSNLGVETIDLYYVHNPETQLEAMGEAQVYERLTRAFELLEAETAQGRILSYGTATWNGYRVSQKTKGYLSLAKVLEAAQRAGGRAHHFKAIQLPYNLGMPEAFTNQNQLWDAELISPIAWAARAGLAVFTSASLLQGRLAQQMPKKISSLFPECSSPAACALQFVRSTPGVTTALVGMKSRAHVGEDLVVRTIPRLSEEAFSNLFLSVP